MGKTFSRKYIQFSCFLFTSTHLRRIWFVWFRDHTLSLVDLGNICCVWGSGCPPLWNDPLAVAFVLFTHSVILVITEWAGKHTHVLHMCSLCYLELEGVVCVAVCVYMRGRHWGRMHIPEQDSFITWISCLLLLACISGFQSTPCLFCRPLYSAVTLGLVMYKCVFKAGLIVLLNVIYVLDRFAHKVNAKPYCTM